MPTITNVSPIGDLDVPLLRCVVKRGEAVSVSDSHARKLLAQPDVWQPVDEAADAIVAELTAQDSDGEVTGDDAAE
jgi:hypothetical protein